MPMCCESILLCSAVNFVSNTSLKRASLPLPDPEDACKVSLEVPQACKHKQSLHSGTYRAYFWITAIAVESLNAFPPVSVLSEP